MVFSDDEHQGRMTMARDIKTLAPYFGITVNPKRVESVYKHNDGRIALMDKVGSQWEGYFTNDHGTTYICDTRRELIADMQVVKIAR